MTQGYISGDVREIPGLRVVATVQPLVGRRMAGREQAEYLTQSLTYIFKVRGWTGGKGQGTLFLVGLDLRPQVLPRAGDGESFFVK